MYCTACVTPEKIATAGERACIVVAKTDTLDYKFFLRKSAQAFPVYSLNSCHKHKQQQIPQP